MGSDTCLSHWHARSGVATTLDLRLSKTLDRCPQFEKGRNSTALIFQRNKRVPSVGSPCFGLCPLRGPLSALFHCLLYLRRYHN